MALTRVPVATRTPADSERAWEGLFLVDTGSIYSVVPRQELEAIGLAPHGQRIYGLANGNEVRLDIAGVQIEFMGDVTWGPVIFGDNDAEPLLGITALESVGIEVDPRNQSLRRLPATRLRRLGYGP